MEKGAPCASPIVSRPLGTAATFRIDLPRRSCFCTRHAMRVCRAHRTYARHTVEMRLDRDRSSLAACSRYDSEQLCCISYFHVRNLILPQHWVGSRSYCVQEETLDALAAVVTSGKNQKSATLSPRLRTYMYPTRLMSFELDREPKTLVHYANSDSWQLFLPCLIPLDYDLVIYAARSRHRAHASVQKAFARPRPLLPDTSIPSS